MVVPSLTVSLQVHTSSVLSFPSSHFFPFLSSLLSDECMQSGRAGSMQSIWLAGTGCHYSPVCIDTERERIKDFKHAYLAMSLTAMFLVFFLLLLPLPPPIPAFDFRCSKSI